MASTPKRCETIGRTQTEAFLTSKSYQSYVDAHYTQMKDGKVFEIENVKILFEYNNNDKETSIEQNLRIFMTLKD